MSHVTGGGLAANLARVLPARRSSDRIDRATWTPAPIFGLVSRLGEVSAATTSRRTLNMGVGMVAMLPADAVDAAIALLHRRGLSAWVCGSAAAGGIGHPRAGEPCSDNTMRDRPVPLICASRTIG